MVVCTLEAQILSHSPGMFFYATADVLITYQTESMRVPDKYVMSVSQTPPGRLCSTAVHRCCRLSSTAACRLSGTAGC